MNSVNWKKSLWGQWYCSRPSRRFPSGSPPSPDVAALLSAAARALLCTRGGHHDRSPSCGWTLMGCGWTLMGCGSTLMGCGSFSCHLPLTWDNPTNLRNIKISPSLVNFNKAALLQFHDVRGKPKHYDPSYIFSPSDLFSFCLLCCLLRFIQPCLI